MEYGLLPAEASLSFIIILFIIYSRKQQFKSSKTVLFKLYLRFLMIYMGLLIFSIVFLKYFGNSVVFIIFWRITHIFLIRSWFTFLYYSYANIFDIKKEKFKDIVKHNFITKLAFVVMIVLCLFFMIPVYIPLLDYHNQVDPAFLTKPQSIITLVITILSVISIVVSTFKFAPKDKRKKLLSNVVASVFAIPFAGMHIVCLETALYPLSFSVIAYILYFSYENPDILLLAETKHLDEVEEKNAQVEFLDSFSDDSLNGINEMYTLCEKFNNIDESNIGEFKNNLKLISKKCNESLELINNAFNASQIKNDIGSIKNQKYNLKELIDNVVRYSQEKLIGKNIKLHINISPSLSSELYGDDEKLEQVLKNVVSYSISTIRVGRVTLDVSSEKKEDIETLLFKIVDTGDGLSQEEVSNLFNVDNENTQGLKIANGYIKNLNGKISVESKFKVGSTFYVQLSQKIANKDLIDFNAKNEEVKSFDLNGDNSKYKILIVDDNLVNSKLTEKILRKYNFNVETIDSGNECIRKIKLEEKYDMIFMDIMMGEVNGLETLKSLRELEDYNLPPVIALTANALAGMRDEYLNNGFDDYLEKPLKIDELLRVFDKFFK